ncbi:hypothetical protein Pst134EA_002473 [Puccinia striiformis f. sp. tritici]|nr:hypothetical protein Pst134EA_002473 [Puccinia striiformis f. sp. tritici]KAH9471839.1 hypothetical protein Pst134EA_002473 [Puccinia striiformis f. sp. tritici]
MESGIHIYHNIVLRVDTPPFLNKSTTHYYRTHTLLSTTTLSINPSKIMFEINNHTPDLDQHSPNHSNAEDHASTKHCQKLSSSNKRSPSSDNTSEPLSDTDAVMTSDYSEFSGSDDEPFSPPSDDDSDSSKLDDNKSPLSPKDRRLKKLLVKIFKAGHQGPAAIRILLREHDITISPRHLARKRKEWNLQKRHLRQTPIPVPLSPEIRASILSSHSKGLNLREMNARLYADTGVEVGHRTVQRYLKKLGLTLLPNDILDGKVTMDQVYNAIHDARNNLLQNNTGYCRMRMVLMRHYNIRVPRDIIYEVLKEIDPEGMAARLRQACKRRIYRTLGPNHIWACDGHDKLKPFGITVYGFVDAWSRKLLGMFVHVTNNDPKHIAVYFLHLASKVGGIPFKVTTDYGTETVDMAAHQMTLSLAYAGISKEEAEKRMHCTKSTNNQEIEAMWSQMMKQHNRPIKDDILAEINSGCYDKDDGVQK